MWLLVTPLLAQLDVRGGGNHRNHLGSRRTPKAHQHPPTQPIRRPIAESILASHHRKIDGKAIIAALEYGQDNVQPHDLRTICVQAPLLRQRMVLTGVVGEWAIASQRIRPVFGGRQDRHGLGDKPPQQAPPMPIDGRQQTAQVPLGNMQPVNHRLEQTCQPPQGSLLRAGKLTGFPARKRLQEAYQQALLPAEPLRKPSMHAISWTRREEPIKFKLLSG